MILKVAEVYHNCCDTNMHCLLLPLQALCKLASEHTRVLSTFGSYLANLLDYLESFDDAQLEQVFDMFGALTSPACEAPASASAAAGASRSSALPLLDRPQRC